MARNKKEVTNVKGLFRIMKLPPEIRNLIWRFTVITDNPIILDNHERDIHARENSPKTLRSGRLIESHRKMEISKTTPVLAIAFTRRQAYLEITPIYYSKNTFSFGRFGCPYYLLMQKFVEVIGGKKARHITSIKIHLAHDVNSNGLDLLPGLRRIDINPDCHCGLTASILRVLEKYAKGHPALVLTERGKPWKKKT